MATRATYAFHATQKPSIKLYIHHDGYPAGAACYIAYALANTLDRADGYSDYFTAERFIRKIEKAEIIDRHDRHADTEYRYDFWPTSNAYHQDHGIFTLDSSVIVSTRLGWDTDKWQMTTYTLRDFLLQHGCEVVVHTLEPQVDEVSRFVPDQNYSMRMTGDHNIQLRYLVTRRSDKQVWLQEVDEQGVHLGEEIRKGIKVDREGNEYTFPDGKYSMAPILRADS